MAIAKWPGPLIVTGAGRTMYYTDMKLGDIGVFVRHRDPNDEMTIVYICLGRDARDAAFVKFAGCNRNRYEDEPDAKWFSAPFRVYAPANEQHNHRSTYAGMYVKKPEFEPNVTLALKLRG